MNINMIFIKKEIENQVVDKLDNMYNSEITEELYNFLKHKTENICKSVYDILNNNECVLKTCIWCLNAQDGFTDALIIDWEPIEKYKGKKREEEIQSTILYNYDALWMTAIHKAFPNNTTDTQCGCGTMELI